MRIGNCNIQSFPLRLQKGGRGLPKGGTCYEYCRRITFIVWQIMNKIPSSSSTIIPFHLIWLFAILIDTLPFLKSPHRDCLLIKSFHVILYPQRKIYFSDGTDIILLLCLFVSVTMLWTTEDRNFVLFIFIFLIHSFLLPRPPTLVPSKCLIQCKHLSSIYKITNWVNKVTDIVIPMTPKWKRDSFVINVKKEKFSWDDG